MTDNEIIKALHICAEHEPFEGQQYTYCGIPLQLLFKEILAFINRKQAEIDVLKTNCLSMAQTMPNMAKAERAEAIKEVLHRFDIEYCKVFSTPEISFMKEFKRVFLKEMVGDSNAE